jgi:hypothetical protein
VRVQDGPASFGYVFLCVVRHRCRGHRFGVAAMNIIAPPFEMGRPGSAPPHVLGLRCDGRARHCEAVCGSRRATSSRQCRAGCSQRFPVRHSAVVGRRLRAPVLLVLGGVLESAAAWRGDDLALPHHRAEAVALQLLGSAGACVLATATDW